MIDIDKYGFNAEIVKALFDIDSIPTTEPGIIKGIPGRLFIVAPEQIVQLDYIINTLDAIPQSELAKMSYEEKLELSSLLNHAIRVRENSISR